MQKKYSSTNLRQELEFRGGGGGPPSRGARTVNLSSLLGLLFRNRKEHVQLYFHFESLFFVSNIILAAKRDIIITFLHNEAY